MEQITKQRHSSLFWTIGGAALLLLLTLVSWNSVMAGPLNSVSLKDGDLEVHGRIDSFPAALIGTWVVDGVAYEADGSTQFKQEEGSFAVDKCVKIAYLPGTSPFTIREVETENDSDCDGGATGTPDVTETPEVTSTPTPDSTPDPGDQMKVRGIVESLPASGLIGAWIVNGVEYLADGDTEFEQNDGPFVVGACVELELRASSNPAIIDEIETENMARCQGSPTSTPEPGSTPGATETPDNESEIYGRIDSFPAGLIGDWVVNGTAYAANSTTEFEQEHGPFANGGCIKLHANASTSPPVIREIETEHDYLCGNGSTPPETPEAEMFGAIQSFPEGLIGTWNIGGMSFIAGNATEFDQENGAFGVGVTVKVHFVTENNGAHRAREIETKFRTDSDDENDDGKHEGAEGHAYGTIDILPAGLVGEWTVGGIVYTANEQTRFEEEDGSFAVGVRTKVEYVTQNGVRVARKFETTSDDGEVSNTAHARLFGYVRQMPANGFVGVWIIDDTEFVADAASRFQEKHGLLGLGAFVSVEYTAANGQLLIHELETHVPPGAGDNNAIGQIDDSGGLLNAAALQQSTWTIGGVAYVVSAATNLNDTGGALVDGAMVAVNSYTENSGARVATQIRSLINDKQLFLPVISR